MESNGKQYPRIHSLSTIGLKQHYNCDYLFHPLRTDFTGDSGIGKSMIADMLQLILVGTSAKDVFKMATDSHGQDRTVAKMIYKDEEAHGLGYTWLNIMLDEGRYIVIGHYITAYSSNTKPFIIQQGYDWDNLLTPFHRPLYYKSLLRSGQILPFEELQQELLSKGLNCESFATNKYLKILAVNEILPVDLSVNRKNLQDYAQIIYSFSRGKGFSKKSKDLKDFIFGVEEEKKILEGFQSEVDHLQDSLRQHYQNNEEIESISQKGKVLEELLNLKKKSDCSWREYLTAKVVYWSRRYAESLDEKVKLQGKIQKEEAKGKILKLKIDKITLQNLQQQLSDWKRKKEHLQKYANEYDALSKLWKELEAKNVQSVFFDLKERIKQIEAVDSWIGTHGGSMDKLTEFYNRQADNLRERRLLEDFLGHLRQHQVEDSFTKSIYVEKPDQARELQRIEIENLLSRIHYKEILFSFFGLHQEKSLSRWALNRIVASGKAFSPEEESIIIYFQKYYIPKPNLTTGVRFLPDPEALMDSLKIAEKTKEGFWLNLSGVWEFIEYRKDYLLNTTDEAAIKRYFQEAENKLEEELEKLKAKKREIEELEVALLPFIQVGKAIELYNQRKSLYSFPIDTALEIDSREFQSCVSSYNDRENTLAKFSTTQKEYEQYSKIETRLKIIDDEMAQIKESLNKDSVGKLHEDSTQLQEQLRISEEEITRMENYSVLESEVNHSVEPASDTYSLNKLLSTCAAEKYIASQKIDDLQPEIEEAEKRKSKSVEEYSSIFKESIDYEEYKNRYTKNPDIPYQERDVYDKALKDYLQEFNLILKLPLGKSFEYKYPDDNSKRDGFATIARDLLPKIFSGKDPETIESDLSNAITLRLDEIQNKNKDISESKLRSFVKHFKYVLAKYEEYTRHVKRLRTFFQRKDAVITGDHRVKISLTPSDDYPLKWLQNFISELQDKINYQTGLFAELASKVSVQETLIAAYREAGGTLETPSEKDLLNPKSYFELNFDIVDENDKSNDGSTGQTYTATALLCLARMALLAKVQKEERKLGLRIMPIDEAEGLGSNYEALYKLAVSEDYQIVTLSVGLVGRFQEQQQYIYMLNPSSQKGLKINDPPFAIFNKPTGEKLIEEDFETFIADNTPQIDPRLSLKEIVGLNRIYLDGKTDLQIKEHPYIKKMIARGIITSKTTNARILEKGSGFQEWYQANHLEAFHDYHNFLTATQIVGEESEWQYRYHFTEDDIRSLILIRSQKEELKRTNFLSKREISSKFFKNSKRLVQQEAIARAVLKVLEVDIFIDEEHDKQYLFTLNCPEPRCIVICENLNFLKLPWKARKLGVELWYCGGSNIEKLDYLPERYKPKSLPIYYSCDWDLAGLRIFQKIKKDYLQGIQLLYPVGTPKKLKDSTREEHKSEWDYTESLSGLDSTVFFDKNMSLIESLITGKEWIEEETNDFDDLITSNNCIKLESVLKP